MKFAKIFNYTGADEVSPNDHLKALNRDLTNITNIFNGRVRLGSGVDGARGENISGEFQVFTTGATTVNTVAHTLYAIPIGFFLINKGGLSDIYMSTSTTASATFVTTMTSTSFTVFLLK